MSIRNFLFILLAFVLGMILGMAIYNENSEEKLPEETKEQIESDDNRITKYNMSEEEIEALPTKEMVNQTENDEKQVSAEQEVEDEGFILEGELSYNGSTEYPKVKLGNYVGLTYYSQVDSRWKNKLYTSISDKTQTIGKSGCGPTSAAMIVTATKGTITPDEMASLFVKYGYRSANNGTYWSAFRWIADVFDIGYSETYDFNTAVKLLRDNHYVVASVGNGLFSSGGHFIVIVGIDGNTLEIYDPYLYSTKFSTSTRRGKVTVKDFSVYCSVNNFKKYANFKGFFVYDSGKTNSVNKKEETQKYTMYVKTSTGVGLNVRKGPSTSFSKISTLIENSKVTVYETKGNWSRIGDNKWVCSDYLSKTKAKSSSKKSSTVGQTRTLKKYTILYSKSNLTGTKYYYLPKTKVKILENVSSSVDKIKVNLTGRVAYVRTSDL